MKIGKRVEGKSLVNPKKNHNRKNFIIFAIIAVTAVLIVWVYAMGKKAEETVSVVMWTEPIYKNEMISESMMVEYKMLSGEFEKYATTTNDGIKKRRIILWDERDKFINKAYAAYPLQTNTVAMVSDLISSRTDNSDTVLYSFPGKNIISLDVGDQDLESFKTFLQPGDRINVVAIYSTEETVDIEDGFGNTNKERTQTFRQEVVFKDILVADLLNSQGQSILDIYASYKDKTTYQQANLDASEAFQESVEPDSLLVALTPEEETKYYKFLSKEDIEFRISLPQRAE